MNKVTITVLRDFDGLNPDVYEVVERVIKYNRPVNGQGNPQPVHGRVTYRGIKYKTFVLRDFGLHTPYHGLAISITSARLDFVPNRSYYR